MMEGKGKRKGRGGKQRERRRLATNEKTFRPPPLAIKPAGGGYGHATESVTHGQCDAEPAVTFPTACRA